MFTDPWMVDFYGKLVGEYTIPMDPMGYFSFSERFTQSTLTKTNVEKRNETNGPYVSRIPHVPYQ